MTLVSCGGGNSGGRVTDDGITFTQFTPPPRGSQIAVINTNLGSFKIAFLQGDAPRAIENFTRLSRDGYYNGLNFHKVFQDLYFQGGDPLGDGTGGTSIWGRHFDDEYSYNAWNFYGAVGMANNGTKNTNGSQFYIVTSKVVGADTIAQMRHGKFPESVISKYIEVGGLPQLDGRRTVFGYVYEGLEVIDEINSVATSPATNEPLDSIVITSVEIQTV
jgi:peptidyl-prolyl cis-trans isomerase B (cyclophilin B)